MIPILALRLEGPLQAWGERARWDERDTAAFPTKSAIVGLLLCARGVGRSDRTASEALSRQLRMGVRDDRSDRFNASRPGGGVLVDYHTVQGLRGGLINAEGKVRSGGNTIISRRQYLQDACFTVALAGPADVLASCAESLRHPRWPVYLGRKCCVPSCPVLLCEKAFESIEDALRNLPPPRGERMPEGYLVEIEALDALDAQATATRWDEPTGMPERIYAPRRVRRLTWIQRGDPE